MKILSRKGDRDFYDVGMHYGGHDDSIVFNRRGRQTIILNKENQELRQMIHDYISQRPFAEMYVFFCGVMYPCFEDVETVTTKISKDTYLEQLRTKNSDEDNVRGHWRSMSPYIGIGEIEFNEKNGRETEISWKRKNFVYRLGEGTLSDNDIRKYSPDYRTLDHERVRKTWLTKSSAKNISKMNDKKKLEQSVKARECLKPINVGLGLFEAVGCPFFIVHEGSVSGWRSTNNHLEKNPILRSYQFDEIMGPHFAYQKIEMFVSLMTHKDPPDLKRTEKEFVQAKGLHKTHAFRTMKE